MASAAQNLIDGMQLIFGKRIELTDEERLSLDAEMAKMDPVKLELATKDCLKVVGRIHGDLHKSLSPEYEAIIQRIKTEIGDQGNIFDAFQDELRKEKGLGVNTAAIIVTYVFSGKDAIEEFKKSLFYASLSDADKATYLSNIDPEKLMDYAKKNLM